MPETLSPSCSMLDADVSFFPMLKKENFDYEKFLPPEVSKESIAGVASLPPYFSNRLIFFNRYGKTFFGKNVPLVFSFLDYPELEKTTVSEYWNQIMMTVQKGDCPRVWILAPNDLCNYIMSSYIKDVNGFYLHQQEQEGSLYFAVANNGGEIKLYPLF